MLLCVNGPYFLVMMGKATTFELQRTVEVIADILWSCLPYDNRFVTYYRIIPIYTICIRQ